MYSCFPSRRPSRVGFERETPRDGGSGGITSGRRRCRDLVVSRGKRDGIFFFEKEVDHLDGFRVRGLMVREPSKMDGWMTEEAKRNKDLSIDLID